jgi:GT2 family glycosyltransferase
VNIELSIIIVSYNVCDFLQKCIKSIVDAKINHAYEIIIVDNYSTDESSSKIRGEFPAIIWFQNEKNLGFAAANNQGINLSKGQFILLLNPDTKVKTGSIEALLQVMLDDPSVGACGSKLVNQDGSLQLSCYPFPTLANEIVRLHHLEKLFPQTQYPIDHWDNNLTYPVDNIQGASLLLRKAALDEVGLLDESFFVYTEEVDLNYRLKKAGWKNVYVPTSEIVHFGGQSTKQNKTEMFLELYKTKIQFFRKHYGAVKTNFYKFMLFETSLMRIIIGKILNVFQKTTDRQMLINNYSNLIRNLSSF